MKTSEAAELVVGVTEAMKSQSAGRRGRSPMRIPQIPMEWMDPMSWRLPSGKALAEFWLQAGFLAPLMLETSAVKRNRKAQTAAPMAASNNVEEARERPATFREPQ
jgi:hypothetical protein